MASDGQVLVAAARWAEESQYLKDFIKSHELPAVVKIVKGQYGCLGVPSLPSPGLQSSAFLVSAGKTHKILAQGVKIKEGRRVVNVGPKIEIPECYNGFFELLSEEGRAVRCIESVAELSRRKPESGCLVRDPIRAFVQRSDNDNVPCATRLLHNGDILYPMGDIQLPGFKSKFLKCMDPKGEVFLLGFDQRCKFSVLAKEDNISGVHTAKNLLSKRMPLTVRLVHGSPPKGLKSSSHFVSELRLLAVTHEEQVFALPLQKDTGILVPLPLAAPIKLLDTRNKETIKSLREFQRLTEKCSNLITEFANKAHAIDGKLPDAKILRVNGFQQNKSGYFLRRSASLDSATANVAQETVSENKAPHSDDYDDIDQIYDYVRGFAPLPRYIRSPFAEPTTESYKPEPPPIETIPTKNPGIKAEKRSRKEVNTKTDKTSIFVKNASTQRVRILRQKSTSPMKETQCKNGSPIVNVRYKSLNNLQTMDLDGTLDSSHSGGRTSGDSGAGAKLPEKRSRRLSRPLSLTNLVWEIHHEPKFEEFDHPTHRKAYNAHKFQPDFHHHSKRIGTLYL